MSDQLEKKFRISVSPGELRLRHDLDDKAFLALAAAHGVAVHVTSRTPLVVQVKTLRA